MCDIFLYVTGIYLLQQLVERRLQQSNNNFTAGDMGEESSLCFGIWFTAILSGVRNKNEQAFLHKYEISKALPRGS